MTRPGARLRFGQKAIVPVRQYNVFEKTYTEGVLGIVVQRIRRAPASKLEGNFDSNSRAVLKRHTAYYAKIIVTNESGNAMSAGTPDFDPLLSDGGIPDVVVMGFGGDLPGCRKTSPPDADSFGRKGAQWVTCVIEVSSPSQPIKGLRYLGPPYGSSPKTRRQTSTSTTASGRSLGPKAQGGPRPLHLAKDIYGHCAARSRSAPRAPG
jgi:hypothetical protein